MGFPPVTSCLVAARRAAIMSDLDGGHDEWMYKLPNPFYFVPERCRTGYFQIGLT
jgi:hypothetical protein